MGASVATANTVKPTIDQLKAIPADLRDRNQWVVWRFEPSDKGKLTKVPYEPWLKVRRRARCNDPASWGAFGAALTVFDLGGYDGISFALSATDPYTLIDLDDCRDPDTGAITQGALEILRAVPAYCELSPSGTGVHMFVQGTLPPGRRRKGNIEMYDRDRFSTMTGWRFVLEAL